MNDWVKLLIAGGVGYGAALAYKDYQARSAEEARRRALAQRGTAGRITDIALQAGRETGLIPASQMNGMAGHMAMPQRAHGQRYVPQQSSTGFYGSTGMRQSGAGNPHAPVYIPRRAQPKAPPPPAPPPAAGSSGEGGDEYEQYSDDNLMGGQRF